LQLRNKTPKRRVKAKLREDRKDATHSNQVWAIDFVHDQLATGRKLRVLTVVDTLFPLSRPWLIRSSPTRARMWCRPWSESCQDGWLSADRSGSTMAASSSPATSIYGPTKRASSSTSHDLESRQTTASSCVGAIDSLDRLLFPPHLQWQVPGRVSELTQVLEP
jgi:hypothetical protein